MTSFYRANAKPGGFQAYCKLCSRGAANDWAAANPGRHQLAKRTWNARNRVEQADMQRHRQYGIKRARYDEMLCAQAGRCAICEVTFHETPRVDHCHHTGVVRGLLCRHCNSGIGFLGDDAARVEAALAYLKAAA